MTDRNSPLYVKTLLSSTLETVCGFPSSSIGFLVRQYWMTAGDCPADIDLGGEAKLRERVMTALASASFAVDSRCCCAEGRLYFDELVWGVNIFSVDGTLEPIGRKEKEDNLVVPIGSGFAAYLVDLRDQTACDPQAVKRYCETVRQLRGLMWNGHRAVPLVRCVVMHAFGSEFLCCAACRACALCMPGVGCDAD